MRAWLRRRWRERKAARRTHHQRIHGRVLGQRLVAAGIIPENTRRTIIDIPADGAVVLYTEHFGDERLFEVSMLDGVQVRR